MKDPDEVLKQHIIDFLGERRIIAAEIQRTHKLTPDLLVDAGLPSALLLEVKTKEDNQLEIRELELRLQSGKVVGRSKRADYWYGLMQLLGDGIKQMNTHDPCRIMPHVIWFHCTGLDRKVAETRMMSTLYGKRNLVSTQVKNLITAFYFKVGAFEKYKASLDGVVISIDDTAQLFLNPFSEKRLSLQDTPFARIFGEPFFPKERAIDRDIMTCDPQAPRASDNETLDYLRLKYDLAHLQIMEMGFMSGIVNY